MGLHERAADVCQEFVPLVQIEMDPSKLFTGVGVCAIRSSILMKFKVLRKEIFASTIGFLIHCRGPKIKGRLKA